MRMSLRTIGLLTVLLIFVAAAITLTTEWIRDKPSIITNTPQSLPLSNLTEPVVKDISADLGWQSAGLLVNSGEKINIQYISGEIRDAESIIRGPAGIGYACGESTCCEPVPDVQRDALIGRVGDDLFLIGDKNTIEVRASGELQLRINDCDSGLFDNSGSFKVRISR
jgi:hypothetical protein